MAPKIILRYSDYEAATAEAHVLAQLQFGRVWWGWWKKDHETFPASILAEAQRDLPTRVGLVDRKEQKYFFANCDAIAFQPNGERTPSPDAAITPAYYRNSHHPAWFRFTSITPCDREAWDTEFLGMPEGDPTLFWIEPGTPTIHPILEIGGKVETVGPSILHISDLHFGDDHAFPAKRGLLGLGAPTMVDILVDRVKELDRRIGVIVVSGDLITKAGEDAYSAEVQPNLERLADKLGVDKSHVVIVPGNHDIPLNPDDVTATPTREYRHETRFRDFLRSFYGDDIREIESLKRFVDKTAGWTINVVGLNSVRLRDAETKEYGYVGHRSAPLFDRMRSANSDKSTSQLFVERVVNVVVLHHHLLPGELVCRPEKGRPVSLTLDAGQLVEDAQDAATHLVLHGHQHIPALAGVGRARRKGGSWSGHAEQLFVLGSGSTGASRERLPDEMRENTLAVYTPENEVLRVEVDKFNPSMKPEPFARALIRF